MRPVMAEERLCGAFAKTAARRRYRPAAVCRAVGKRTFADFADRRIAVTLPIEDSGFIGRILDHSKRRCLSA